MHKVMAHAKFWSILILFAVIVGIPVFWAMSKYASRSGAPAQATASAPAETHAKTATPPPREVAEDNRGVFARAWDDATHAFAGQCSVRGKTISLNSEWTYINRRVGKSPLCRVIFDKLAGDAEFLAEGGKVFPAGGWVKQDAVAVRAKGGAAVFKYSLCNSGLQGPLDWSCNLQAKAAEH